MAKGAQNRKDINMEEQFTKIVKPTGLAYQDNETFKTLGDFIPERDQFYFELKSGDDTFLLGSKDMLICLRLLEKLKEIKKIDEGWWVNMTSLYGDEILMVEYEDVPPEQSDNT